MIYGYIRVSTDKQTVENQRFEINTYANKNNIVIENWIEETISGTISPEKRNLGALLKKVRKNDVIICSELSRLGRSMFMIMSILNQLMEKGVMVCTVKEGYKLGDDLTSKVLAVAFSISAEIERTWISQRPTAALKRRKSEGVKLGRPCGKADDYKLSGYEDLIEEMQVMGISKACISRKLNVSIGTLYNFLNRNKSLE